MKRGNPLFIVLGVFFFLITAAIVGALIWGLSGHSFSFFKWEWRENRFLSGHTVLLQEETYALTSVTDLEIIMVSEDLRVTFTDDESVTIRYYGPEDWEERLQIEQTGHSLRFISPLRNVIQFSFGFYSSPHCEVLLPKSYAEQLALSTVSGELDIGAGIARYTSFRASTTSGDLDILSEITADNINISSISGEITANILAGGRAAINSTSGEIRITTWAGGGSASTISGTIDIRRLRLTDDVKLSSTSGDVNAVLAVDTDVTFKANTISGDIETNFPVQYEGHRKNKADAFLGGGTHQLNVSTMSGNIDVYQQ